MPRLPQFLPRIVLIAVLLAGCGSESDSVGETATPAAEAPASTPETDPTQSPISEPTKAASVSTPPPTSTADASVGEGDQPVPVVEELEPMDSVPGGNVGQVYSGTNYPPELGGIIEAMIADVAEQMGLGTGAVQVLGVAEVTWSDGSLGCGQPGLAYAQVLTDGMRVVLQANDLLFDYRASGVDAWFLCSQSVVTDKSSAGLYEITEDGVVQVEPPEYDEQAPTEGTNPPDE